jgi:uncharacterized protein YndB with AHSA1/START domain
VIDVPQQLAATTRESGTVRRDDRDARVVVARRTYPSPVEDVWDALTSPERLPRWFQPVSGELQVGGRFQVEGNGCGQVVTCDPPRSFEITWEMGEDPSWVVLTLTPQDGATALELRHTAHVPDEFWGTYGPGAVGVGWELSLLGLGLHLGSGEAVDPAEVEAWSATDEGRAYLGGASDGWADAAIAGGEDEEVARAAGRATTAFYTGVPQDGAAEPADASS